jgi:hypothetical protein
MLYRAASEIENCLLSNYPNDQRGYLYCAGRITVDAREKE